MCAQIRMARNFSCLPDASSTYRHGTVNGFVAGCDRSCSADRLFSVLARLLDIHVDTINHT